MTNLSDKVDKHFNMLLLPLAKQIFDMLEKSKEPIKNATISHILGLDISPAKVQKHWISYIILKEMESINVTKQLKPRGPWTLVDEDKEKKKAPELEEGSLEVRKKVEKKVIDGDLGNGVEQIAYQYGLDADDIREMEAAGAEEERANEEKYDAVDDY